MMNPGVFVMILLSKKKCVLFKTLFVLARLQVVLVTILRSYGSLVLVLCSQQP